MGRRVLLILGTMLLGVMLLSGVALAKNITGTNGPDRLVGTPNKDQIYGLGGKDYIAGKQKADALYGGRNQDEVRAGNGRDHVFGGQNADELYGGGGNDVMSAADGYKDDVDCGLGADNAYVDKVDRVNRDCENVFVAGRPKPDPKPGVDKVSGSGVLGEEFGVPRLRVSAKSTGTTPDDARGQFSITYPDAPENNLENNTEVEGTIVCLAVTGNEAQLVGQIDLSSGPKAEDGTFEKDEYVRMGVLDEGSNDKVNFSKGEQTFKSCIGEDPTLDVEVGKGFVVKDVK